MPPFVPLLLCVEVPQEGLHTVTPTDDSLLAEGTSLPHQLVVASAADKVTQAAHHDPGVLSHVLEAGRWDTQGKSS